MGSFQDKALISTFKESIQPSKMIIKKLKKQQILKRKNTLVDPYIRQKCIRRYCRTPFPRTAKRNNWWYKSDEDNSDDDKEDENNSDANNSDDDKKDKKKNPNNKNSQNSLAIAVFPGNTGTDRKKQKKSFVGSGGRILGIITQIQELIGRNKKKSFVGSGGRILG